MAFNYPQQSGLKSLFGIPSLLPTGRAFCGLFQPFPKCVTADTGLANKTKTKQQKNQTKTKTKKPIPTQRVWKPWLLRCLLYLCTSAQLVFSGS